jgi:hypothetical protein
MQKRQELYINFLAQGIEGSLTPREKSVIQMIADGKSFEEIGILFSVTRERIRQIADKASRKIARIMRDQEAERRRKQLREEAKTKNLDSLMLEDLEISRRTYNGLRNCGVDQINQLANLTEADLLHTKNFGRKSLFELKEVLAQLGLGLGEESKPISPLKPQKRQADELTECCCRENFIPFYIITEECYKKTDISAVKPVWMVWRFEGSDKMRLYTLDEIENEYGKVEAQSYKVKKPLDEVHDMVIWTETFVIIISSNGHWEWLQSIPRNPSL